MDGVEALGRAWFAKARFGDEARSLVRGFARRFLHLGWGVFESLDQPLQVAFDAADAGDLLLNPPKLLSHIGNLPFELLQLLKLRGVSESRLEPRRDVLHARVQRFHRCRGHGLADRVLKPVGHLDQALVEIFLFAPQGGQYEGRGGIARFRGRHGEAEFGLAAGREVGRGEWRSEQAWLLRRQTGGNRASLGQSAAKLGKVVEPGLGLVGLLQPPRQAAELAAQPLEGLGFFRRG